MHEAEATVGDKNWRPLVVLGVAQFLMVLDSAVMNVSVSQLVEDFDTEVTAIQAVITFYSLVMAAAMITGGKLGDLLGRRRAFRIGLAIYGIGSALTAAAWSVPVLLVGWSILEGLGAALVLPALAALVGGTYRGRDRAFAYGVLGGLAGTGVAVGPIVGGFFTATLSWRWVFVGEALIVLGLLALSGWLDEPAGRVRSGIDGVGAALSAGGLTLIVLGVLQSSSWGWLQPRNSPVEPFGLSLTPFVLLAGGAVLWLFTLWQHHREAQRRPPIVRIGLLRVPTLRSGLGTLLVQNTVLLGVFFTLPLYLQLTQGLDALETGIRLLPISLFMMAFSMGGPIIERFASPRRIVRAGLVSMFVAGMLLIATIQPALDDAGFAVAMAVLGIGVGLLASQLGNIVQSAVGDDARSEVGGLQYTAQNLGSALGTALVGAVLLSTLTTAFLTTVEADPAVPASIVDTASTELRAGVPFVAGAEVAAALADTDLGEDQQRAIVADYEESQLVGLRIGILVMAAIALAGLFATSDLPSRRSNDLEVATTPREAEKTANQSG